MTNFGFIIDNRRCIGCHACTVACKSEHEVAVGVNRTWVKYIEKGQFPQSRRLFSVMRCNHCDDAPCVEICPVTALFRREDGIVDFDNRRCIGCKACMQACPYDALYIDPNTHTAAKCNYCAHRIDIGLEPACVNVCPTQAIISGDLDDPNSRISQLKSREVVTVRKPEKATKPALFYIEGDRASLEPTATEPIGQSMWSHQTSGVGHYASYVEKRVAAKAKSNGSHQVADTPAENHTDHPLDQLHGMLDLGDRSDGVLNPRPGDKKHVESTQAVEKELARRAYDAPNKGILWGWQVSAYVWTKAIAAGVGLVASVAAISGLATVTPAVQWLTIAVALAFMAITGYLLTIDLDQPKRFLYVILRPQWRSWLVRGAYIISIYSLLLVMWPVLGLLNDFQIPKWFWWPLAIFSGLTAVYTAFLFAQAKGRDFWQSPLLSVHMLLHSGIAGAAIFAITLPLLNDASWQAFIPKMLMGLLVTKLIVDWFELASTHATADAKQTVHQITKGSFARMYWLGVVLLGCLIPIIGLATLPPLVIPICGFISLVGLYLAEHIWVRAPQQIPLS